MAFNIHYIYVVKGLMEELNKGLILLMKSDRKVN